MSGRDDAHPTALTTNLLAPPLYSLQNLPAAIPRALPAHCSRKDTETLRSLLSWRARQSTAGMTAPKEIQRAEIQVGQALRLPPPEEVEEVPKLCTA